MASGVPGGGRESRRRRVYQYAPWDQSGLSLDKLCKNQLAAHKNLRGTYVEPEWNLRGTYVEINFAPNRAEVGVLPAD